MHVCSNNNNKILLYLHDLSSPTFANFWIFIDFELSFQHSSVVYKASGRRRIALYTGYRRKCTLKAIDNAYRGQTRRNLRVFTKNSIS